MWDCPHCGCMNITPTVLVCPQCFVPQDVAAESGQPAGGSEGSPVGSKTEELSSPPSGDNPTATSPSPKIKTTSDWGKE
jgi:hypothetical protein